MTTTQHDPARRSATATGDERAHAVNDTLRAALSARTRPPRPSPLSATLTFGWRALLRIKHVPEQLFDVTAFPVMSTLLFTYLFGGALAGSTKEYAQYLLPGILAQTVIWITMDTGVALNTDITKGVFDRFRTLPLWQPSALAGPCSVTRSATLWPRRSSSCSASSWASGPRAASSGCSRPWRSCCCWDCSSDAPRRRGAARLVDVPDRPRPSGAGGPLR